MKRVLLVIKRTSYTRLVLEERSALAGADVTERLKQAHDAHTQTVDAVVSALTQAGLHIVQTVEPGAFFNETDADVVMSIGGDGTLLAASHHVHRVPIAGINSAPGHSVGHFCTATLSTLGPLIATIAAGDALPCITLCRMEVSRNATTLSKRVLNEALFCHASPAATSRYALVMPSGDVEEQKSSGVWVGPPAGSTAAQRSAGGVVLPLSARMLQFVVREPYDPEGKPLRFARGLVQPDETLCLVSQMHDGRLFVDGPSESFAIALGDRLAFRVSDEPLQLVKNG